MRKSAETEQERTRRLDQLIRSLVAENRIDAERSAELQEALEPFAAVTVSPSVQEALAARFGTDEPPRNPGPQKPPSTALIRA